MWQCLYLLSWLLVKELQFLLPCHAKFQSSRMKDPFFCHVLFCMNNWQLYVMVGYFSLLVNLIVAKTTTHNSKTKVLRQHFDSSTTKHNLQDKELSISQAFFSPLLYTSKTKRRMMVRLYVILAVQFCFSAEDKMNTPFSYNFFCLFSYSTIDSLLKNAIFVWKASSKDKNGQRNILHGTGNPRRNFKTGQV